MTIGQWLKNKVGVRGCESGATTFESWVSELIGYCWKFLLEVVILTGKAYDDFRGKKCLRKRDKAGYLGVKKESLSSFWDLVPFFYHMFQVALGFFI